VSPLAGRIGMGARREITAAPVDRYRSAWRADKRREDEGEFERSHRE
jgi:hypothetical protein